MSETTTITPAERDRYLNGQCAVLASAIHEITGWQVVVNTDDDGNTGHAMVRRPDGKLIDITCEPWTDEALIAEWTSSVVMDVDWTDLRDWGWETITIHYGEPVDYPFRSTSDAINVALRVLAEAGEGWDGTIDNSDIRDWLAEQ